MPKPGGRKKLKPSIPFPFVLDHLESHNPDLQPETRRMFGCLAVYVGGKLVLILRDQESHPSDNGVWIVTRREHHPSLDQDIPGLRSVALMGAQQGSSWRNMPADFEGFESGVERICTLIRRGDPRIGIVPSTKSKVKARKSK